MLNPSKAGRIPLFARPLLSKVTGVTRSLWWKEAAMAACLVHPLPMLGRGWCRNTDPKAG